MRQRPGRHWSILCKLGLLVILGAAAFDGAGSAIAQDGGDPPTSEPAPEGDAPPPRAYFHLFPVEGDEIAFDDLSASDQEGVTLMAERSDYGPEVHAAWSSIAHQAAADAAARRAAQAAGMSGLDEAGLE